MFRTFLRAAPVLAIAVLAACSTDTTEPDISMPSVKEVRSEPLTLDWHATARGLVAANNLNPLVAGRIFAALGMAQRQAVEMVMSESGGGNDDHTIAGGRSEYEARRGAVAGASVRVLSFLVPSAAASLEQRLADQSRQGPGGVHPQFTRGVEIGRSAGNYLVQHLMADRFTTPWDNRSIPTTPGSWTPAAMPPGGGMMGQVVPYFLTSATQFRPAAPPAYLSTQFNADLVETANIVATATPAQIANARHWNAPATGYGPLGIWNELAATYVAAAGLDEAAAAQVMALTNAAMFDALIACFEAKYHFWTLRPHQANPAIVPHYGVPNYPAYPSGHQSISSAAARVLTHFFPQRAAEIEALRAEASESRIIGGIHYRHDQTAATALGTGVANWVLQRALQ